MPLKGSFKIEDGSSEWVTYTGAPGETVGSVVSFSWIVVLIVYAVTLIKCIGPMRSKIKS